MHPTLTALVAVERERALRAEAEQHRLEAGGPRRATGRSLPRALRRLLRGPAGHPHRPATAVRPLARPEAR